MISNFNHPSAVLAGLGAVSGFLGTFALGFGFGEAPHPGIYMVLTGVWFGLVVGYGVWTWANRSLVAAAAAFASTWVAWQCAVNLAVQIDSNWLKSTDLTETARMAVAGLAAGALGAFLTWVGTAWSSTAVRQLETAAAVTSIGAAFGLLLPLTNHYDSPAVLLVPWQAAVAAMLGWSFAPQNAGRSGTRLPSCPLPPSS
jgi:hypothetical protein